VNYFIPNHDKRDLTPEEVLSDSFGEIALRLEKSVERKNFIFFGILIASGILAIGVRVLWLTTIDFANYAKIAENNRTQVIPVQASRGLFFDRSGGALIANVPVIDLVADPAEMSRDENRRIAAARGIAGILGKNESGLDALVEKFKAMPNQPFLAAEDISATSAIVFEARKEEFEGVSTRITPGRAYSEGSALFHVLGFLGRVGEEDIKSGYLPSDFIGKNGLESEYENLLKGERGKDLYEVNSRGVPVRLLEHTNPRAGENLVISINRSLQAFAYEGLAKTLRAHRSGGGAVVAIDPHNGNILAMVSAPSADAGSFSAGIGAAEYDALLNDPGHPFFNRAIAARYPVGSTLKPFMGVAALTEGVVTPNTVINDTGSIVLRSVYDPSATFVYHGYAPLGPLNIYGAIAKSSDIYFYTVGGGFGGISGLGVDRIARYLDAFGFGKKTGVDIPGENGGLIPTPEWRLSSGLGSWRIGDTYNMSIGQGDIGITPLQLAVATAAIANGGTLWKPMLALRSVDGNFNTIRSFDPEAVSTSVAPSADIEVIRKAMRQTVLAGTARILGTLPVSSAAKTGTAQTGKSSQYHALVTVWAPFDDPQIVLAIIVEKAGEGNEVAVPLARDILEEYFKNNAN
jgi:penicillin-binding protein 2